MGSAELAVRMSAGELGCTYAAMILHDDGLPVTEDGLKALLNAAKVEYDSYWPSLFAKYLDGNMDKLITTPAVGGGGGGPVAAAAPGDAAPGAPGAGAKEKSESDDAEDAGPVGGGLFGDDGDEPRRRCARHSTCAT